MKKLSNTVNEVTKIVTNFWQLALYTSMIGLAAFNLYQVKTELASIAVSFLLAVAATVVAVEGTIRFIKYLSK